MPSTYSQSLRIELIGDGEQDAIWGQTTNNNLGSLVEQAIAGITTVDVTAADVTLTSFNGTADEARSAVLVVNGSNAVTRNVVIPNASKTYIVRNNTSQTVGIKTTSGSAYNCTTGTQALVYCDGANGVFGVNTNTGVGAGAFSTLSATGAITGASLTVSGAMSAASLAGSAATGSGASGTWGINISGNAATATNATTATNQSGGSVNATSGAFSGSVTVVGNISANGNVTAYAPSDKKFKTDVAPVQDALNKVKAIGTKTFNWTDEYLAANGGEDAYLRPKSDFGVIAQDVQKVFPQAVRTRPDGSLAVDYEKLSTLSFQALIELSARVEALEVK